MDMTGIQTRVGKDGVERYRGRVKDRGKWVPGPWRTSLADARGDRVRMQARKLDGPLRIGDGQTVAQAAERFLDGAEQGTVLSRRRTRYAAKTVRGYRQAFEDWINPELGHVSVERLRRSQVQRWVDWVDSQRAGATTRNTFHALAALYSWLLPRHDDMIDPTDGVLLPAPSKPREHYAAPGEIGGLLEALPPTLALPYALAFYAGLRHAEIQAFRWEDVDGEWLTIRRAFDPGEGFKMPKSDKPRHVPLFAPLVPYLVPGQGTTGWVFPAQRTSKWGVQILGSSYKEKCDACWKSAGLPSIGLHEARHSFVTALVRAGYDIKVVAEYAGHADPATTLRIYTKERGRQDGMATLMNTLFDPPTR
jgi:integrase